MQTLFGRHYYEVVVTFRAKEIVLGITTSFEEATEAQAFYSANHRMPILMRRVQGHVCTA